MKYEILVQVNTLEVPESENIPQQFRLIFESDSKHKIENTQRCLAIAAGAWKEFAMDGDSYIDASEIISERPFFSKLKRAWAVLTSH